MGLPAVVTAGSDRDDVRLGREITLLTAQINTANFRLLKLIAEFDRRGAWRCGGALRSCAHWLAANCHITIGAAREKVRVARQLAGLPGVERAFSSGELSYSKVRAITRVATPANEGFLVTMAEQASASHLEKLVGKYQPAGQEADAVDADAIDEETLRENLRELFWFQDENGMWVIHARLPPEQGQLVVKALEAVSRPLQEERLDDWKAQQKARMQAVVKEMARRHQQAGVVGGAEVVGNAAGGDPGRERGEPATSLENDIERAREKISAESFSQFMNQVRADAFAGMAEHFLATAGDYRQLQGLTGAERCQVVLHVDVNTLRQQRSGVCCTHGRAHFEDKPWLSPQTARRLGCDASLVTVLEDEHGKVLNVGRRSRVVPAAIRRALMERDGVCQYPGCHESRYVDAHHIKHWADGGETSLENLVTLCRFHHRQLHRGCLDLTPGLFGNWANATGIG